jgi:RNA polymerase sigma factor (sigma-70 family)
MDEHLFADAELQLSRLKRGDETALAFLRQRLYNLMMKEAIGVIAQRQDAEDVVEQAFCRLWKFRAGLPDDWVGAKKYIMRIVRNTALDQARLVESRIRKVELSETLATPEVPEPDEDVMSVIALQTAPALLQRIGRRHQRILCPVAMRLSAPYDDVQQVYADVAQSLGTSSNYVRNIWSEIGKELKSTLPASPPESAVRELLRVIGTLPASPQPALT